MKSNCCQASITVVGGNNNPMRPRHYMCDKCREPCIPASIFKPLKDWKELPMSNDEALLEGIRVQNEKYAKLLSFVQTMAEQLNDEQAQKLLKEIGEHEVKEMPVLCVE